MRIPMSGLIAASLLTSHFAAAECARPADHAAFDVTGLKTQLMVTALTCSADERYNAFVMKYRPDLVAQEKSLNTFFSRAYGRSATKQHDDYITQLANSQSQTGLKQGTLFCDRNIGIFRADFRFHDLPIWRASPRRRQRCAAGHVGPNLSCAGA